MSDTKLRELEMEWKAEAGNFAHEGGIAVAYLAELLRVGQVTLNEAALAWRIFRIESLLGGPPVAPTAARGRVFDPESQQHACGTLWVLLGQTHVLTFPMAMGMQPPPSCVSGSHIGPVNYDGDEPVCARCGEVLPPAPAPPLGRNPFFSPPALQYVARACRPEAHLGPINYDTTLPTCERCHHTVMVVQVESGLSNVVSAPRQSPL